MNLPSVARCFTVLFSVEDAETKYTKRSGPFVTSKSLRTRVRVPFSVMTFAVPLMR